jgi:hypothetical protein
VAESEHRAVAPVIGNLLLVAVVIILGLIVSIVGLGLLEGFGTPTGEAAFEFEQRPAGVEVRPTALGTDVVIELNGEPSTHSEPVEMGALRIARDFESNSQYFNGEIYEMRLYYTALDEEEIERITAAMS